MYNIVPYIIKYNQGRGIYLAIDILPGKRQRDTMLVNQDLDYLLHEGAIVAYYIIYYIIVYSTNNYAILCMLV